MRFKKMGNEAALQAEEDYVNVVHNLVHQGRLVLRTTYPWLDITVDMTIVAYLRLGSIKMNHKIICT